MSLLPNTLSFHVLLYLYGVWTYGTFALPVKEVELAGQSLQLMETSIAERISLRWKTTGSVESYLLRLSKYKPDEDQSYVMYLKEAETLEAQPAGLNPGDESRYSLTFSEDEVVFEITVVTQHDTGIYRLEIRKPGADSVPSVGLVALTVASVRAAVTNSPATSDPEHTEPNYNAHTEVAIGSANNKDGQLGASSSSSDSAFIGIIVVLVIMVVAGPVVTFFILRRYWLKDEQKAKTTEDDSVNGDIVHPVQPSEGIHLLHVPESTPNGNRDLVMYSVTDDQNPSPVYIDKEKIDEVRQMIREGEVASWIKFCNLHSNESDKSKHGLNLAFATFTEDCGIDDDAKEWQYLKNCFDRAACHDKVVELPFISNHTGHCEQGFIYINNKERENGTMGLELCFVKMKATQNSDSNSYEHTDEIIEGYDLGYQPSLSTLGKIPDDDKRHYFRYEALERFRQEGLTGANESRTCDA